MLPARLGRIVSLAVLATAAAADPQHALSQADRDAFRWFDSLGYPAITKAPFVRLYRSGRETDRRAATPEYGFLLSQSGDSFEVFTVGLETMRCSRTATDTPPHRRAAYEETALDEYVRSGLRHLADPPKDEERWEHEPFGHRAYMPKLWFRVFVLAYACGQKGHPDLAYELMRLVEGDEQFHGCGSGAVFVAIRKQIAAEAWRNVIRDFGDPRLSWTDLLVRIRGWKSRFGEIAGTEEVEKLGSMVRELAEPRAAAPGDPVTMLIRELPDTQGTFCGYPAGHGAAAGLVRVGPAAVSQLLDAWEDARPSRSLLWCQDWKTHVRSDPVVVPVGRHVRAILEEIAGREFRDRAEAVAWFDELRRHGERTVLVRAVSSGRKWAARSAARLKARHPESAEAAILVGITGAEDPRERERLVCALRDIRTDAANQLLLREIRSPEARRRVVAASLLLLRGIRDGVAAVADAWRGGECSESVTAFLCGCGADEAIVALRERFDIAPVRARIDIVSGILGEREWFPFASKADVPEPDPEWVAEVERLLVHALADEDVARGRANSEWSGYSSSNPRVCDLAACALAARFPERYDFDPAVSIRRRDRQLLKLRNRWRIRHGLPALPVPELRCAVPLSEDEAGRLRERFLADLDTREIESRGVSALPVLSRWLTGMAGDDPARAPLEELHRRLACRVTNIDAPEERDGILGRLADRPLTPSALVTAIVDLADGLPEGATGYWLTVSRDSDGAGIAIRLRLERGNGRRENGWDFSTLLYAGGERLLDVGGARAEVSKEGLTRLELRLARVLAGNAYTSFEASLWFVLRE